MFMITPSTGMSGNYQIRNSLRYNSADSATMSRTPSTTTNRKTWTYSIWVKRATTGVSKGLFGSELGGSSNTTALSFDANDKLYWQFNNATYNDLCTTSATFRDLSAWYHIVWAVDTTQATAANRSKLYVNGVQQTVVTTLGNGYPVLNFDTVNSTSGAPMRIGSYYSGDMLYTDGYIAEVVFVDGQQLTPSSFGKTDSTTGQWVAKKFSGTYGTNGFYLPFDEGTSTTTLGYDRSGNSNNFSLTNFTRSAGVNDDWFEDTPTNNFCVLNPLNAVLNASSIVSDGGLALYQPSSSLWATAASTLSVSTGQWYWEVAAANVPGRYLMVGVSTVDYTGWMTVNNYVGGVPNGYGYYSLTGNKYSNNVAAAYGATYTTNDVIGIALDMDAGTLTFYKNGVSQGVAYTGLVGALCPAVSSAGAVGYANFGQRAFAYTPPTGYKALCTKNLPVPTIKKSSKYFNTVVWNGDGTGATRSIDGVGFSPDVVWTKCRTNVASHLIYDVVRGAGNNSELISSSTVAEGGGNPSEFDWLSSFDTDGFTSTYGGGAQPRAYFNLSGHSYVAWNWKAGEAPVSNTDGSIASSVSANPTSGFSIVTYTGTGVAATVGHGLGLTPSLIIIKNLSASYNWPVWSSSFTTPTQNYAFLNLTNAVQTHATAYWNGTAHTSSNFSLGTSADVNANGNNFVAYCFAEVPGFSKIGKYVGNGSADGPFVYCGFKPRYIMYKRVDAVSNWWIHDTVRNTYNLTNSALYADLANAEDTGACPVDILSNGFKCRSATYNASGGTYIFIAFAEAPTKYATAR